MQPIEWRNLFAFAPKPIELETEEDLHEEYEWEEDRPIIEAKTEEEKLKQKQEIKEWFEERDKIERDRKLDVLKPYLDDFEKHGDIERIKKDTT